MGLIHIELFATLDLVGQAPGVPDEDPEGFPFGGWQAPLLDEVAGAQVGAAYEGTDALLLGRRTYDIFAAYWPYQEGGQDDEIATLFNRVPKYVASRGRPDLSWAGSTQLGPDLAGAVREIRDRHEHVKVVGSLNLVQTLLREKLFDRLDLWVHPVVLGVGKKVFDGGAVPTNVTLLEPPVAGPKGTVYLRYGLAERHARDGGHERTRPRCLGPRVLLGPHRRERQVDAVRGRQRRQHAHRLVEVVAGVGQRPQRPVERAEEVVPVDEDGAAGAHRAHGLAPVLLDLGLRPQAELADAEVHDVRPLPRERTRHEARAALDQHAPAGGPVRRGRSTTPPRSGTPQPWPAGAAAR